MTMPHEGDSDAPIYGSAELETIALVGEFDARVWARYFVATVRHIPEIATDEETMLGWFASAIMAGYDRAKAEAE
jgi:hypothetical protein